MTMCKHTIACGAAVIAAASFLAAPPVAGASQLIDRNAANVQLAVNQKGEAMVTYTKGGATKHVLAWGAVNALPPTQARKQVAFSLDYSGGWGKHHAKNYWDAMEGVCLAYDGPGLAWKVAACKAPDGSYWALQSWQRALPDLGVPPTAANAVWELRLSHWTGAAPALSITTDWSYRRFEHLFGTYTYGDVPIFGFTSTARGNPLDTFGRNIYLDTFNSKYGAGWKRENSFLTHRPKGAFCYGFYPHGSHPIGAGTKYRATAEGPGVAPDAMWEGASPGPYDGDLDAAANDAQKALADPSCKVN
jgi:hypothetical protein